MIGWGTTSTGQTNDTEIVDLENLDSSSGSRSGSSSDSVPGSDCQELPDYPLALEGAAAFLNYNNKPEVCGGGNTATSTYYEVQL